MAPKGMVVSENAKRQDAAKLQLIQWISAWLCRELKLPEPPADLKKSFVSYGMDSVHAMMLVGDLEDYLGRRLPPTLAWNHPTVEALAGYLAQDASSSPELPPGGDSEILKRLDTLSEEEIDRLLRERMKGSQDS